MLLSDIFNKKSVKLNLESTDKSGAFNELIDMILENHPELDKETALSIINERENKMNTSIAPGVAVPHGYYPGISHIYGALGISKTGIDYKSLDNEPVRCIFMLILGESGRENHLRVLTRIMSLVNSEAMERIRNASSADEISGVFSMQV